MDLGQLSNQQWILPCFALVSFIVVLFGLSEIIAEWRRLLKLKNALNLQEQSPLINR